MRASRIGSLRVLQVYKLLLSVVLNVNPFDQGSSEVPPKYGMMGKKKPQKHGLKYKFVTQTFMFLWFFLLIRRFLIHNVAIPHGGAKVITDPRVFPDFERHH